MPKVYNKHHRNAPPGAVYVGRPGPWGNQHPISDVRCQVCSEIEDQVVVHNRNEAIEAYERDITPEDEVRIKRHLAGKDLVCWCAPAPCHADVLLRIAND